MMLEWFREREARGDLVLPVPAAGRANARTPVNSNRNVTILCFQLLSKGGVSCPIISRTALHFQRNYTRRTRLLGPTNLTM